jgi:hypothetical protein
VAKAAPPPTGMSAEAVDAVTRDGKVTFEAAELTRLKLAVLSFLMSGTFLVWLILFRLFCVFVVCLIGLCVFLLSDYSSYPLFRFWGAV